MSRDDFFEEAVLFRNLASEMHAFVGQHIPCSCVMTKEYQDFEAAERELLERLDDDDRLFGAIFGPMFEGEKIERECDRCAILYKYEEAIGEDAVDLELLSRLKAMREENGNADE